MPEHAHDWPVLSLFIIGSYRNETELGSRSIDGPSAILYRAGAYHRNTIGPVGFEQIEIEFDPAWIGSQGLPDGPVTLWAGGTAGGLARRLARTCALQSSGMQVRGMLQRFLEEARRQPLIVRAGWIERIGRRLRSDTSARINELAFEAGRHPSWVGSAYARATGETVQESAARLRVERATNLLRESSLALSSIAAEAGFCDQSHMNRTFRRVLGRSPANVREERLGFRR